MDGLALASEIDHVPKLILSPFTASPDLEVPAVILNLLSPWRGNDFVEPAEIFLMVLPTL